MVDYQIRKVCAQGDPGWVSGIVWDVVQGAQSTWNPSEFRGSSFISKKRQVSLRISQLHIGHHLFAPPLLNRFQSSFILLESYFQGESNAVCYEGRGLLFMENVSNYRNCTTQIILETIGVYPIRTYPFWTLPLMLV